GHWTRGHLARVAHLFGARRAGGPHRRALAWTLRIALPQILRGRSVRLAVREPRQGPGHHAGRFRPRRGGRPGRGRLSVADALQLDRFHLVGQMDRGRAGEPIRRSRAFFELSRAHVRDRAGAELRALYSFWCAVVYGRLSGRSGGCVSALVAPLGLRGMESWT